MSSLQTDCHVANPRDIPGHAYLSSSARTLTAMDDARGAGYPQRAELIAELCGLWKAARRPLPEEWKTSVLDSEGWDLLSKLADRLARHLSFEHLGRRELRDDLVDAVRRYKSHEGREGRSNRQFAADVLDGLAQDP